MDISSAMHESFALHDASNFNWHDFVAREELIRYKLSTLPSLFVADGVDISTLIYIFLMDTAFVMFNNLPPRMAVKELKMDLACPEPCFQATTSAECFSQIQIWTASETWAQRMSL